MKNGVFCTLFLWLEKISWRILNMDKLPTPPTHPVLSSVPSRHPRSQVGISPTTYFRSMTFATYLHSTTLTPPLSNAFLSFFKIFYQRAFFRICEMFMALTLHTCDFWLTPLPHFQEKVKQNNDIKTTLCKLTKHKKYVVLCR